LENLNQGIIPEGCKNCIYKNNEEIYNDKIQRIDLYYWYHCNCGCFYCSYRDETKGEFSDREKEGNPLIYNTLKELYNLNQIDKDHLIVCFGGGELGVLKEFPKLIDLFMKNNVEHVICESSGIKYSKAVEKLLKNKKGTITVAVCAGSRETYKKIKNRDKYEKAVGRDKFLSRLFLFVNLGCFILGLIVPSIRIVTLLIQMISLILQIYFQSKEIVDKNKLMNIKAKITRLKKKHSNNPAVAKQLDGCLAKLNKVA